MLNFASSPELLQRKSSKYKFHFFIYCQQILNFKKVEEELRRDFVTGNTVTIQTETSTVTSRPEINQLKSRIEQATQGTDTSSGPSLMSFQDRINDLQDRVMQNLCGAAKLMMLEDQERARLISYLFFGFGFSLFLSLFLLKKRTLTWMLRPSNALPFLDREADLPI